MSDWTICITAMPTEEALDVAARIADAEEPDYEDLLLTDGARALDALRCEVLHQAEVIERTTADLSTATGEVDRLRAAFAVATRSLEAATTGERLTTCDELARLSREVATLRAAYATDLAGLRAEVRRADDERAVWRDLRDAARGMLAALEAPAPVWDADESEHDEHAARLTAALDAVRAMLAGGGATGDATERRDLPAEAVVSCPACGYGITADLDDGAYITRRHSRREPARVGLGGIVWCDGGLVVP